MLTLLVFLIILGVLVFVHEFGHFIMARRNGIKATALTVKAGARTGGEATGEITLEHAASLGCDLLVKSAFTQSRLRQMIFGGATRHILANATLPVFMAH